MIWIPTIVLALLLIVVIYKYGKHNAEYKVIGNAVYKDRILFCDELVVEENFYNIHYTFKEGRLCEINVRFRDNAALYAFPPYWKVYCYGKNGDSIKASEFSQLYTFDINPNSMLEILIKKYPSLESLPKIEQKSPDVSGRFIFLL